MVKIRRANIQPTAHWVAAPSTDFEMPFFEERGTWVGIFPVPFDLPPSSAVLEFSDTKEPGSLPFDSRTYYVTGSTAAVEIIRFNQKKAALLNDESEASESREIRKVLHEDRFDPKKRWAGRFQRPVPGEIISQFGVRRNKIGQNQPDTHWGVDFRADQGLPVLSPAGARVLLVRKYKFHGNTILLSHGRGVGSIYIHLEEIGVSEGDEVEAGDEIGRVGSSGLATGPHLHWGIYVQGKPVDPEAWLRQGF